MEVPGQYQEASRLTALYEHFAWAGRYPALPTPSTIQNMDVAVKELEVATLEQPTDDVALAKYFSAGMAQLERAEIATAYGNGHPYTFSRQAERQVAQDALHDLRMDFVFDGDHRLERLLGSVASMQPGKGDVARIGLAVDVLLGRDDEFALLPHADRYMQQYARKMQALARLALQNLVLNTFPGTFLVLIANTPKRSS